MTVWNQAAFKQRMPPRKYKPVAPVGTPALQLLVEQGADVNKHLGMLGQDRTCRTCGYFVCSCPSKWHVSPHTSDPGISKDVGVATVPSGGYARQKPHMAQFRAEAKSMYDSAVFGLPPSHWFRRQPQVEVIEVIAEKLKKSWPHLPSWKPGELENGLCALPPKQQTTPCMQCGRRNTALSGRVCSDERSCYETYCARQGSEAMK